MSWLDEAERIKRAGERVFESIEYDNEIARLRRFKRIMSWDPYIRQYLLDMANKTWGVQNYDIFVTQDPRSYYHRLAVQCYIDQTQRDIATYSTMLAFGKSTRIPPWSFDAGYYRHDAYTYEAKEMRYPGRFFMETPIVSLDSIKEILAQYYINGPDVIKPPLDSRRDGPPSPLIPDLSPANL